MAIIKTNRLNMTGGGVPVIVRLSQYDDDFTLVFELYSTDGTFTIPSGTTAEVRGTKNDGKGYSASATIDITNKKVTVTGDQQMTAVSGKNIFELTLWKSNKELNSANFILDVEPAALDRNTIVSESKIMELLDVTDRADEIIEAAETIESSAAQIAKNTQDIAVINEEIARIGSGFPDDAKIALLNCFAHVAWINEHGQDYHDALEVALYAGTYPKITAVFDAGLNVIYADDALDTLKQYLTVKYYETEESSGVTVPSTDYTLYGTLSEGSNTLRATYEGLSASFVVDNVIDYYNQYSWSTSNGLLTLRSGGMGATESTPRQPLAQDWSNNYPRYSVYASKGLKEMTSQSGGVASGIYPIPVPSDATVATVNVTPSSTQYFAIIEYYYTGSEYDGVKFNGWPTNGSNQSLQSSEYQRFITVATKYDTAGTSYPTPPTDIEVVFS